ncbi:divergent protein kinase domain 2A-like isoform X1 [Coccinella septempunctata]|uniref:divergent protein kinase domain 2A-like isoform X1 n=1 Tax=Coccinella septempunctata TaxID=41139 RepID=UPI001D05DE6F|nr:divergent protein kinase domain 2A-like isoform X1 [Coccinella septempunctata]
MYPVMAFKLYPALGCFLAIILYIVSMFKHPLIEKCEVDKCPLCYGTNMCDSMNNSEIELDFSSFDRVFNNLFSVKNVFYGKFKDSEVVLKKLGQDEELVKVLTMVKTLSTSKYRDFLVNSVLDTFYKKDNVNVKDFHVCNLETAEYLLEYLYQKGLTLEQIWTIKQVNVEPLLLKVFKHEKGWPVPKYFGACGRMIVQSYCGVNLNYVEKYSWIERATIAVGIINAAEDFTTAHQTFSLYLTDISPDNIVVDHNLNVYFIDLENGILQMRNDSMEKFNIKNHHRSRNFEDEPYAFSTDDICSYQLSDHNIYSVCKLLLSSKTPWPMMKGGLLHSPPNSIRGHDLFKYIELCVEADDKINRFAVMKVIVNILRDILNMSHK